MSASRILVAIGCLFALAVGMDPAWARGKPPPPPTPAPKSPPARYWHMFTGNGGIDGSSSRLYLYGGEDDGINPFDDLWYYQVSNRAWTLVAPNGKSRPGPRMHAGWSCGGGVCVMEDGLKGAGLVDETWVYTEGTNAWSKIGCSGRSPCPSWRKGATMAYDADSGRHLLFGGEDPGTLTSDAALHDDTYTFDAATRTYTKQAPSSRPAPRAFAAAVHVPGIGVVLFGGVSQSNQALCDMFVWTGSDWASVTLRTDPPLEIPCLQSHSMAWHNQTLIVVGGFDSLWRPNSTSLRFTFDDLARSGKWSTAVPTCVNESGDADTNIYSSAKMAFDSMVGKQVFFGGFDGNVAVGNTVECYD